MERIQVKVKKLRKEANLPKKQRPGDAAWDLYAIENVTLNPFEPKIVRCGLACDIPPGHKILIYGRSGLATRGVFTHIGTVDETYRGEVGPILINLVMKPYQIYEGDRVGQIVVVPTHDADFIVTEELSESVRGIHGFGSSGK